MTEALGPDDFEAKGGTIEAVHTLGEHLTDFAFKQANEFIDHGQTAHEATSIVANILLRVAWIVAGCGASADGNVPNRARFRERVEHVLKTVEFDDTTPHHDQEDGR